MKPTIKKLITQIISWGAVGGILWILLSRFFTNLEELQSLEVFRFRPIIAAAALLGFTSVIAWWGIVWWVILPKDERKKLSLPEIFHLQAVSWLARYVPGKAGSILGKIILGKKNGISGRSLVLAGAYEQLLQVVSAFLIGFGFVGWAWVQQTGQSIVAVFALVILIVIFTLLHPKFFYPVSNKALSILNRKPLAEGALLSFSQLLGITAMYAFGHLMNGLAFFLMVKSISPVMNSSVFIFVGAFVLAGVIGVVSLFAPSGLGVREGVMAGLLSMFFPMEEALLYSLMSRIFSTLADGGVALYWGGFILYKKGWGKSIEWIIYGSGLAVLLVLPLFYTGSYIDEYWHIFAGRGWIESWQLNEIYVDRIYTRGSYVSIFAGIVQHFFGDSLYFIKLIPITISVLIWILWWDISRKVISGSAYFRILFFILWISNPWLLVNHSYIRIYIIYELLTTLAIWISLRLMKVTTITWYFITTIVTLGYLIFTQTFNDNGSYLVLLIWLILAVWQFITRNDLKPTRLQRQIISLIVITGVLLLPYVRNLIEKFLTLDVTHGSPTSLWEFMIVVNPVLTIIASFGTIIGMFSSKIRPLSIVLIACISLHSLLPVEAQMTRTYFYFFPIVFYMCAYALHRIPFHSQSMTTKLVSVIAIIPVYVIIQIQATPVNYWQGGPYILDEINYIDYAKAYQYTKENCSDRQIFETSPTPYLGEFYGVEAIPLIDNLERLQTDPIFYSQEGEWFVNYDDSKVVTSIEELPDSYCWIRRNPSLGNYLLDTSANGEIIKFVGIEVVVN